MYYDFPCFVSVPVVSMCNPIFVVTFAPAYTLFTPSAYGVLLAVVDVDVLKSEKSKE
jgi:hypothetical protein